MVVGQAQLLDAAQVLLPELVAVAGDVPVVTLTHWAVLPVAERVPDALPFAVGVPAPCVETHTWTRVGTNKEQRHPSGSPGRARTIKARSSPQRPRFDSRPWSFAA